MEGKSIANYFGERDGSFRFEDEKVDSPVGTRSKVPKGGKFERKYRDYK